MAAPVQFADFIDIDAAGAIVSDVGGVVKHSQSHSPLSIVNTEALVACVVTGTTPNARAAVIQLLSSGRPVLRLVGMRFIC